MDPVVGKKKEPTELLAYSSREILYDVKDELERSSDPEYLRRKLHRQRIRDYRRNKVLELQALQDEASRLQAHITRLTKSRRVPRGKDQRLPWQDIAIALGEAAATSKSDNVRLKAKIQAHRALLGDMTAWVSSISSVPRFPNANASTWRNVCLFKSDESRKLGFEWMTDHMLHHTSAILDMCAFPSTSLEDANFMDLRVVWDDMGRYRLFQRHQTVLHASLDRITAALRRMYITDRVSVANIIKEDLDTQFLNDEGRYSRTEQYAVNPVHFLRRQYTEPGYRSIVVGQNILDDQKYPVGKIVVTQVAPNVVLYQNYYTVEQMRTKDGEALPLERDVWSSLFNLEALPTEAAKRDAFTRQIKHQWVHIIKGAEAHIRALCAEPDP
ncbi:hypothetical protein ACHHYP_14618 [Achlya hypogyna]|uniref:Uncharacterized protein n=1 Tax=Achlya hypogyna TaxID=1202772 RepID=A0A1V9YCR0_ACHHY|nr:hypothetical protein ACHHYP_14618 [Achlya hypogyna]